MFTGKPSPPSPPIPAYGPVEQFDAPPLGNAAEHPSPVVAPLPPLPITPAPPPPPIAPLGTTLLVPGVPPECVTSERIP